MNYGITTPKEPGKDYPYSFNVLILPARYLGENSSGWVVYGYLENDGEEDMLLNFCAFHSEYGAVFGDYSYKIYASSDEAFNHFYHHHGTEDWC
ncbi:hypothetical protein Lepto7375DRAFT_7283 [Leptolyngbya sp. PCC 7375]|nr:hypothetical protein Lepto7375DRAFT_7283 [Leptolyngbya sp. PCC 7375]